MSVWSGLGISAGQPYGSWFEFNSDTHTAIGAPFLPQITRFPRIRITVEQSSDTSKTAQRLWAGDIKAYSPNTYILYGIANSGSVYLPSFYSGYLTKVLTETQWAQDNLMDAFTVANEFEVSGQVGSLSVSSLSRASNVSTVITSSAHGLQTGDTIVITGASPSSFNVSQVACTVLDTTTLTYVNAGVDESATGTILLKTGETTIIRFVKALAAAAQAVFTRGPIIYSVSQGHETYWTSITPGTDIDLLGFNIYGTNSDFNDYATRVAAMYAIFGSTLIITECNLHASWSSATAKGLSPSSREFDTAYADVMVDKMNYARTLGITQFYFFSAWNASSSENNNFSAWYNTNTTTGNGGALQGGWKSIYDRLLGQRVRHVFLGTQQHT